MLVMGILNVTPDSFSDGGRWNSVDDAIEHAARLICHIRDLAEQWRSYGIEAEASRQATRGVTRNFDPIWRVKARDEARLRDTKKDEKTGAR